MYHLSEQQIDYIFNDISARGVEMESLQQNLLDHICCIIENNLEEKGDFESFYQKTIKTFYKDVLWEIEEETLLLLTYKNYYTMKKVMIVSGILSVTGFIAGSIFKIMHWPGAGVLLLLSMATISLVFLPLLFVLKAKETSSLKNKLMIGTGTTFGILFSLSSLFKITHWPGANIMWFSALGILLFVFIPLYFFNGIRNPETKINTIVTTIILIAAGGMLFALTSLKPTARSLNNTEIDLIVEDEKMLKSESEKIYQLALEDTNYKQAADRIREVNELCNKLKTELLQYEFGYNSITSDLKDKNLAFTIAPVSNFFDKNDHALKKLDRLNNLVFENSFKCYAERLRITHKQPTRKAIVFESSILQYNNKVLSYYYNNTVLGAYKDLCKVQLNAIQEIFDLVDLKNARG